jgi:hypothetical protein
LFVDGQGGGGVAAGCEYFHQEAVAGFGHG